jgi:hypothetical protein
VAQLALQARKLLQEIPAEIPMQHFHTSPTFKKLSHSGSVVAVVAPILQVEISRGALAELQRQLPLVQGSAEVENFRISSIQQLLDYWVLEK